MVADTHGYIQFLTARGGRPRQRGKMVIGRNADKRRILVDRHQPRDRQIGFTALPVFGDDGACCYVWAGLTFEEMRYGQFIPQRRIGDNLLLAGS